jgi:hypothetical protein
MKTHMSRPILSIAAATVVALSISIAQAADPASTKSPSFGQLDANRDGYIDAKEATASSEVTGWLISADKDKDGRLSANEFSAIQSSLGIGQK